MLSEQFYKENPEIPIITKDHVERESETFQAKFFNMLFI